MVTEEPLELRLGWPGRPAERVWVTMRTPGHDFELAAGWAFHEGLLRPGDLDRVAYCTDAQLSPDQEFNVVTLALRAPAARLPSTRGDFQGGSACGVCGTDSIDTVLEAARHTHAVTGAARAEPLAEGLVPGLSALLQGRQPLFERTGGAHAAALVGPDGQPWVVREDVGRHNAVDKVTGARLLAGEPVAGSALLVSGRAGFELVQKAVAAGTGALVAVGAPTSLSVDLAGRAGLHLYGFTRADRAVRYA